MRTFNINFAGNLKKYLTVSAILFAIILVFSFVFGVSLDIQFRGGSIITYSYEGELDTNSFASVVGQELSGATIQYATDVGTGLETAVVSLPGNKSLTANELVEVNERLASEFAANNISSLEVTNVDATMGREFLLKCLCGLVLAIALILLFVAIRFRRIGGLSAGVMGVVALLHDCIIVFGVFVIFRIPLNSNFIAAILTIFGYSLNDTIVIYDRIRENRRLHGAKMDTAGLVNLSINQSLVRSINTTITTILAMIVVTVVAAIFNVSSIFSFSLPLICGLISGTYSSVCLSGPLWVKWQEHKAAKKA